MFLPQRRKGAKKNPGKRGSALRLCDFAGEIPNFAVRCRKCTRRLQNQRLFDATQPRHQCSQGQLLIIARELKKTLMNFERDLRKFHGAA